MAKKAERKIVDEEVNEYWDFDVIDGKTFDQVIEQMEMFKPEYIGRDVYFSVDSYGYDGGKELKLRERRLETDKEFNKRIEQEQKEKAKAKEAKATKEAKEFLEYQRLQKKFQGKSGFQ